MATTSNNSLGFKRTIWMSLRSCSFLDIFSSPSLAWCQLRVNQSICKLTSASTVSTGKRKSCKEHIRIAIFIIKEPWNQSYVNNNYSHIQFFQLIVICELDHRLHSERLILHTLYLVTHHYYNNLKKNWKKWKLNIVASTEARKLKIVLQIYKIFGDLSSLCINF